MMLDRRALLAGLVVAGCAPSPDRRPGFRVVAAGQPAAVLIQALRPEALAGWPRRPSDAALAALRPALSDLPELGALTASDAPASAEAMAALSPDLILDYGDPGPALRDLAAEVRDQLGLPYALIDGALDRTPDALRQAGALLERGELGIELAAFAADILSDWRGSARATGARFFYARGRDGLETADAGSLATEVLEGAGWINVVPARPGKGLFTVGREQVAAWAPDIVVTLDADFAAAARADPIWSRGDPARVLLLPRLPFGWLDQPPSINRLLGCAWLGQRDQPASLADTVRAFHATFYGRDLSVEDARRLIPA